MGATTAGSHAITTTTVLVLLAAIALVASACGSDGTTSTDDERRRASASTDVPVTASPDSTTPDTTPDTVPPDSTIPDTVAPGASVDLDAVRVGFENSYLLTFSDPASATCFATGLIDLLGAAELEAEGVINEAEAFDYANAPADPEFEEETYEIIYNCVSPAEFGPLVAVGVVENPTADTSECMGQVFLDPSNRSTLRRFVDFPGLPELLEADEQASGVIGTAMLCLNRDERKELMAPIVSELDPLIADCAAEELVSNQNFTLIFLAGLKGEIDEDDPNDPGVRAITDVVETCTA